MTEFTQEPGKLDITVTHGDDFLFNLDFDIALTGYTFSAQIVTIATNTLVPLTVTNTDLSEGQLQISLAKATLSGLANAKHHWYLDWTTGGKTRRVLAGDFLVINYP
jgi:hypothetical protein